ncbi:uncharacterized protein LOC124311529 [Daphnia pulicaria]|uniref:uncharacterized protein LOC124311529 n=1 Tax=Daphnia pulicaria TaxID=35523 RepID=UPI001EE9C417|nr:uncharacterized protein LOC124311529 [Daphnia pulicaria]
MCQNLDGGFVIKAAPPPPAIARVNTLQHRHPPARLHRLCLVCTPRTFSTPMMYYSSNETDRHFLSMTSTSSTIALRFLYERPIVGVVRQVKTKKARTAGGVVGI